MIKNIFKTVGYILAGIISTMLLLGFFILLLIIIKSLLNIKILADIIGITAIIFGAFIFGILLYSSGYGVIEAIKNWKVDK